MKGNLQAGRARIGGEERRRGEERRGEERREERRRGEERRIGEEEEERREGEERRSISLDIVRRAPLVLLPQHPHKLNGIPSPLLQSFFLQLLQHKTRGPGRRRVRMRKLTSLCTSRPPAGWSLPPQTEQPSERRELCS
eukprot:767427-Hanusia_phi.AAC.3